MWQRIELAGRQADVLESPKRRFGLIFLHDYNESPPIDSEVFTQLLRKHEFDCICPHGGRTFWTDRLNSEFHPTISAEQFIADHVLREAMSRWSLGEHSVALCGFGIGGQGALRLAFRHSQRFPAVAAIAPGIEFHEWYHADTPLMETYQSKEQCRQDTAPLHIHPNDFPPHIFFAIDPDDHPWFRGCDRLHEKLSALGIAHECDLNTRRGGHSRAYFEFMAPRAVEFLASALERIRRRLL